GVMIAGAGGEVASRAETMLASVRQAGSVPVPGRRRRADLLDAAFLGGTAAHGIELDGGYTNGSVHPGCTVVPAVPATGYPARDGFLQAFAGVDPLRSGNESRPIALPPDTSFGITDCYIKPNPCCRHIQPATEALIEILDEQNIADDEVEHVAVETYRIAAEHA